MMGQNPAPGISRRNFLQVLFATYARSGYVSYTFYSRMSLLRFAETIFDLEPLTERDSRANDMLDCFDFDQPSLPPLPLVTRDCPRF